MRTVKDLIQYLKTLDPNKDICAEYVKVYAGTYLGIETRPLLEEGLIEDNGFNYIIKAKFY